MSIYFKSLKSITMSKKNYSKFFINGLLSMCFLGLFSVNTYAQDVTDADLYKYAVVMETLDLFQAELSAQITEYVEQQDVAIKNRYNALAGGETPANDAEKQFIGNVNKMKDERSDEFKGAFNTMIKRVLGVDTYKAVNGAIKSDPVKTRYEEIVKQIRAAKGSES
jgi:hypothetical protein